LSTRSNAAVTQSGSDSLFSIWIPGGKTDETSSGRWSEALENASADADLRSAIQIAEKDWMKVVEFRNAEIAYVLLVIAIEQLLECVLRARTNLTDRFLINPMRR